MRTVVIPGADALRLEVPIVPAIHNGQFAELAGDRDPSACDHAGAGWSDNIELRCARCGAQMFLPPRVLANLPAETIEEMYRLWRLAGWPSYSGRRWHYDAERWTLLDHPLFVALGGLPVRLDRLAGLLHEVQP